MPGENLTRQEAQERAALVAVQSYDVALDLTTGDEVFRSTTTVRFQAHTPGASTFIDHIAREVLSVTFNGVELDVASVVDGPRIALADLQAENELTVVSDALYVNTGEGLHRFVDPVDGEVYLYSQFEVPDSRRVFTVFEQPDLKAEFTFTITAPARWQVVSNQPTPEPTIDGETGTWRFGATPRISSYITALVAGPYWVTRDSLTSASGQDIPLGIFCRASLAEHMDADAIFATTKAGFAFYEEHFQTPYPFDKYDQLFVPEFNAGAMENAGCVTFTEAYVFRSKVTDAIRERRVVTILHELAHMWFGDLVTMRWWNDLWLNESFAEWASTLATAEATEWTHAWTTFQAMEKTWAYRQDQLPSTHPIVAEIRDLEDVQVNFDGITYAKGGSVLKQLVAWVGLEAFMRGLAEYFRKHSYGNTDLSDLLVELEAASGRELSGWASQWLETAGVNTLRPELETTQDGIITSFAIAQTATADYPTLRPHRIAVGFYAERKGKLQRVHRVELDIDGASTAVPQLVGHQRPDLVLINDDDLAYAKIRLDEQSTKVALAGLSKIEDPLARALVWGAAWDATRDGETPASDYVELVLANIGAETESTTVRLALAQLAQSVRTYVAPERRAGLIETTGDRLWELANAAKAGSDLQLQLVQAFAGLASSASHVAALQGLLDGSVALKGLEVDADLRWQILDGVVLNGAAGDAEIDALLATDDTATGRQFAARARATIPTAEAKERAFASVADAAGASNLIVRYTGMGLQHVNDPADLATLIERYHAALIPIWESRTYQIAEGLIVGLYPSVVATEELAAATRQWLAEHQDVPALRRLVQEQLAGVERALRVQERDRV
ncbi:aminopeptidase N [Agrococcus jejuensis]|uniref:Aminopeptidase N n=1 Tax=Agrococcus jejuensis TaxID=399736 RepID=A0A1G8GQ69_9MICO|nr:aminopeptidase N [Agrococcus jejuensis]SDH96578.1 aminopeptidase N [Agrococcus jejuensis]